MLLGFTVKVTGTVAELFLPLILTHILENVISTQNTERIILFGILMVFCAGCACLFNIVANRMAAKVSMEFSRELRRALFSRTLYLSARDTDRFTVPSLESRITTDTYNVHHFVGMMQRMGVRAPILLIGGMVISFVMDAYLATVMLATLPFIFFIVYFISRKGVPLYTRVQSSVDDMVRVVREDAQGIRVIKALSKNEYENKRYDRVNRSLSKEECHAGTVMGIVNPTMTMLMNLGIAGVVALCALGVANNTSSPSTVIAFMQYFTLISMAMMTLSRVFVMYTKCAASAGRIAEVMNTPDSYFVSEDRKIRDTGSHIEMRNVSFSYFGKKNNLENISFSIGRGERLGIIGATGSGKSTVLRLLLRFYEADEGEILIGGRSITSYTREELCAMFGVALQSDFLYADTIEENIKFGRDIPRERVVWAAKVAQAHGFITEKEGGYGYVIAPKGTDLSGGQRQRLLIARAVASSPEILILDDSSSALDYKTDASLRQALARELPDSTLITVAQRVSSVKDADTVIVLDEGHIIGIGRHEELLASCPEYREISESQMGGALIE